VSIILRVRPIRTGLGLANGGGDRRDPVLTGNQGASSAPTAFATSPRPSPRRRGGVVIVNGACGNPLAISAKPSTSTNRSGYICSRGRSRSATRREHAGANIFLTGVALTVGADNSGTEYDGVTIGWVACRRPAPGLSPWLELTPTPWTTISGGTLQVGSGSTTGSIAGNVRTMGRWRLTIPTQASPSAAPSRELGRGQSRVATLTGAIFGSQSVNQPVQRRSDLDRAQFFTAGSSSRTAR